jgi:hypothetical protein
MELCCYPSSDPAMAAKVAAMLGVLEDRAVVRVHPTLRTLEHSLRSQCLSEVRCLLAAATRRELQELLDLAELLQGLPLILVLPEADAAMVSAGHRLRPRLLANPQAGYFREMIVSLLLAWTSQPTLLASLEGARAEA